MTQSLRLHDDKILAHPILAAARLGALPREKYVGDVPPECAMAQVAIIPAGLGLASPDPLGRTRRRVQLGARVAERVGLVAALGFKTEGNPTAQSPATFKSPSHSACGTGDVHMKWMATGCHGQHSVSLVVCKIQRIQ